MDRIRDLGVLGGHWKNKIYFALERSGVRHWIRKGAALSLNLEFGAIQAGYRPRFWCRSVDFAEREKDPDAFKFKRVKAK